MKMNRKYMHVAYVRSAIDLSTMETLAGRISGFAKMEVDKVKSNGFVLRQSTGDPVDISAVHTAVYKGLCDVLDDDIEETTEYISENYDMVYNPDDIDSSKLAELFDISRDGRLFYIELDL